MGFLMKYADTFHLKSFTETISYIKVLTLITNNLLTLILVKTNLLRHNIESTPVRNGRDYYLIR